MYRIFLYLALLVDSKVIHNDFQSRSDSRVSVVCLSVCSSVIRVCFNVWVQMFVRASDYIISLYKNLSLMRNIDPVKK